MIENKEELKKTLRKLSENDFHLKEKETAEKLLPSMLGFIGDPDPVLRDELIYSSFCAFVADGCFLEKTLSYLTDKLISEDFIFRHINEKDDLGVFHRSFSVLFLAETLNRHAVKPYLSEKQIDNVKNALIKYINCESDLRGYDETYGWAHAVAHTSDAFCALLACGISHKDCEEILYAIQNKFMRGEKIFVAEEDERAASFVYKIIIKTKTDKAFMTEWLKDFSLAAAIADYFSRLRARINCKNLIRDLYFRIVHNGGDKEFLTVLSETEAKLNRFVKR
jgi:hypothetical protein